jgi:hypothetical protein
VVTGGQFVVTVGRVCIAVSVFRTDQSGHDGCLISVSASVLFLIAVVCIPVVCMDTPCALH